MCSPPGSTYDAARPPRWGFFSSNRTRKPASASATAEESPARPPPITITLFEDIFLGVPAEPCAQQDPCFFRSAQPCTLGEYIITARFDAPKQAAVDSRERPKSGSCIPMNLGDQ